MAGTYGPAEYSRSIEALGPFEAAPHVAVACSGGPDSMALALLTDGWARSKGGRATALIVDHGMRDESAEEAATVCARLNAAGIEANVLARRGPAIRADRQAQAREARYALLSDWCRGAGVLHLALGHHRGDQAETLMLRLGRGSGVDGLAAMAPVAETPYLRLLRPLLEVPRSELLTFLESCRVDWVADPSNEDESFSRIRVRQRLPDLEREGLTEVRLAATARRMARARRALEEATTDLLARAAAVYPEGYATASVKELLAVPEEVGLRALSRLLLCIGGGRYGPRLERLEGVYRWLGSGAGRARTLAGCKITRSAAGTMTVCREAAAAGERVPARRGALWDGRFRLATDAPDGSALGGLGADGWAQIRALEPECAEKVGLPADVRAALPALWRLEEVLAVPHFDYHTISTAGTAGAGAEFAFQPGRPLGPARFSAGSDYA